MPWNPVKLFTLQPPQCSNQNYALATGGGGLRGNNLTNNPPPSGVPALLFPTSSTVSIYRPPLYPFKQKQSKYWFQKAWLVGVCCATMNSPLQGVKQQKNRQRNLGSTSSRPFLSERLTLRNYVRFKSFWRDSMSLLMRLFSLFFPPLWYNKSDLFHIPV